MRRVLLPYVVVPAAVCGVVTGLRVWLELNKPDHVMTRWLSASVLSLVWAIARPVLFLRAGLSLLQGLVAAFLFFVLFRLPIGWVYAAAWSGKWKVAGSDDPVRYVTDIGDTDTSAAMIFLNSTFVPTAFGLAVVFVLWSLVWAIGFRGKRPFAAAGS